jgi:hypothetical protein
LIIEEETKELTNPFLPKNGDEGEILFTTNLRDPSNIHIH